MNNYEIVVETEKTMFGKRTGLYRAALTQIDDWTPVLRVSAPTKGEAKQALLNACAALAEGQYQRRYIICGDRQTMLSVYRLAEGSGYDIISAGRLDASSCTSSASLDELLKVAKDHAVQSYGGVLKVL